MKIVIRKIQNYAQWRIYQEPENSNVGVAGGRTSYPSEDSAVEFAKKMYLGQVLFIEMDGKLVQIQS